MQIKFIASLLASSVLGVAGTAIAQTDSDETQQVLPNVSDNAPVVLSGTVGDIREDEFDLNYSDKKVTVELERFGWGGQETDFLVRGEPVTVTGYLDEDLFEGREIKAYTVRLEDSDVYYYTTLDYPTYNMFDVDYDPESGAFASIRGTITARTGDVVTIENDTRDMLVDVSDLSYDPFDDEGRQKLDMNDDVYVYGNIDDDFYASKILMADGVVELVGS